MVPLALGLATACGSDDDAKPKTTAETTRAGQTGGTPAASETRSPSSDSTPELEEIFNNGNIKGVTNQPTIPTTFTIDESRFIYSINDYHWNGGQGKTPGTIGLKAEDGTEYGPWETEGMPGQGGAPDAYWICHPGIEIPAGTYTIIDSDPATWARNPDSNGAGFSQVIAEK